MAVVVGYVRNSQGRAALQAAVDEAFRRRCRLIVVHSSRGGARESGEEALDYREDLQQLERRLREQGLDIEVYERVRGNPPAVDVLEVADEVDAQLIVIGLRRRSPVGKLVLGSNAQEILLAATRPVLAVKASDADRRAGDAPLSESLPGRFRRDATYTSPE